MTMTKQKYLGEGGFTLLDMKAHSTAIKLRRVDLGTKNPNQSTQQNLKVQKQTDAY